MQTTTRSVDPQRRESPGPTLDQADQTALAALRSGCSFAQAAEASGLGAERVRKLWESMNGRPLH